MNQIEKFEKPGSEWIKLAELVKALTHGSECAINPGGVVGVGAGTLHWGLVRATFNLRGELPLSRTRVTAATNVTTVRGSIPSRRYQSPRP